MQGQKDQNCAAASGDSKEKRCVRYMRLPFVREFGIKWQQFVEVLLFFDLWFEEQFSVDYIQVSLCSWSWRNFCLDLGFQNSNRRVMISLQMAVRLRWSGHFFVWYPSFYTWKPTIGWSTFAIFSGRLMVFTPGSLLPQERIHRKSSLWFHPVIVPSWSSLNVTVEFWKWAQNFWLQKIRTKPFNGLVNVMIAAGPYFFHNRKRKM